MLDSEEEKELCELESLIKRRVRDERTAKQLRDELRTLRREFNWLKATELRYQINGISRKERSKK